MTKAQILRKKTGIVLAIIGIVLSLLPAIRMADGSKQTIFRLIRNGIFIYKETMSTEEYFTGIVLMVVLIYGLLVHILNLILWLKKKETTYLGVMGFSWASFLAMVMSSAMGSMFSGGSFAQLPYTIWQFLRIFIILAEAIMKLNGEELFTLILGKEK